MIRVRKLRHWKQRFDKNAAFIWSKSRTYAGVAFVPGDKIPDELNAHKAKLRRFWESNVIELAEFEAPNVATGQRESAMATTSETSETDLPDGVTVEKGKGSWFLVSTPDGVEKINGQKALNALLEELRADDGDDDDNDDWLDGSGSDQGGEADGE